MSDESQPTGYNEERDPENRKIFWACLVALVATSFVFGVRSNLIGDWQETFGFNETRKGEILGVGLWPFAFSIIVFSLIIDRIGYKNAAYFAIFCHLLSITLTVFATNDSMIYWSTFIVAIGNGTVEAFINPVVATIFRHNKAKWLNILHAGWPLGIALGVIFSELFKAGSWQFRFGLCFIPVIIYALLIIRRKFPVQERVAAGVTYRDMLREVGSIGFLILGWLVAMGVFQMAKVEMEPLNQYLLAFFVAIGVAMAAGWYTRSAGSPIFIVILLTMGPLATTELGTDTWMIDMLKFSLPDGSAWILAYSAIVMTILRCYAGPIVHAFSPIGLLVASAAVAIAGLLFFSQVSTLFWIVCAATVYAFGKTFLWSTTLGVVSERFPKGGALTLNGVSAVGVLGMGIIGSPLMGKFLDDQIDRELTSQHPALHEVVKGDDKATIFGQVPSLDAEAVAQLSKEDATDEEKENAKKLTEIKGKASAANFYRVAALPTFMLIVYVGLFLYFKRRGGYKPIDLHAGH